MHTQVHTSTLCVLSYSYLTVLYSVCYSLLEISWDESNLSSLNEISVYDEYAQAEWLYQKKKKSRQMHNRSSWWKIDEITRKMNALYKNIIGKKNHASVGNTVDFISAFIAILITFFVRFVEYENSYILLFFFRNFVFRILNFLTLSIIFFSFEFISFPYSLLFFLFLFLFFVFCIPTFFHMFRMYVFHFVSSRD